MIENLDLDQSSHRSYLDELDDIDAHLSQSEKLSYSSPQPLGGIRSSFAALCATIKNWFHRKDSDNGDGAIL
jgi:hypothetical protein